MARNPDPRRMTWKAPMRTLIAALPIGLSCVMAACGTSRVSDELAPPALAAANTGVAVMMAGFHGVDCPSANLWLARKKNSSDYQIVQIVKMIKGPFDHMNVAQVELEAGEYHIVSWDCTETAGARTLISTLGSPEGGVFGFGVSFKKSLANFTIAPGEIINLGYLSIFHAGTANAVRLEVRDLPQGALEKFKQDRPRLSAQMRTRFMTVVNAPISPEQMQALCAALAKITTNSEIPYPLPAGCAQFDANSSRPPIISAGSTALR